MLFKIALTLLVAWLIGVTGVYRAGQLVHVLLLAGQTVERRFTNVWKNEDGTWRLCARHANVIPTR